MKIAGMATPTGRRSAGASGAMTERTVGVVACQPAATLKHRRLATHGHGAVMHCQLKQAACRLGRCPTYVQDRRMLAGPYPTCTERHMTLLVREPRLATKMARQRE